jgi:hypothetical protein
LKARWARDRESLKKAISAPAQREFARFTERERIERHEQDAWEHPESRLLHIALVQLAVRTSEAGVIVDAWFADSRFDEHVQSFLAERLPAEDLIREARVWQRRR